MNAARFAVRRHPVTQLPSYPATQLAPILRGHPVTPSPSLPLSFGVTQSPSHPACPYPSGSPSYPVTQSPSHQFVLRISSFPSPSPPVFFSRKLTPKKGEKTAKNCKKLQKSVHPRLPILTFSPHPSHPRTPAPGPAASQKSPKNTPENAREKVIRNRRRS